MTKNLTLPSGNNLTLPSGNNLVLSETTYEISSRGYSRRYRQVTSDKVRGYSQREAPETSTIFSSTMRGRSLRYNNITAAKAGRHCIYGEATSAVRGGCRFVWLHITGIVGRGHCRIINSVTRTDVGRSVIKRAQRSKQRGSSYLYNSYPPITSRGAFNIWETLEFVSQGRSRVENNSVEGNVIYIGYGEMPDFSAAPAGFSATLPVNISITPPVSGTIDLYVVRRTRNRYGVESQNQIPTIITIDSNGDEVLGPLSTPTLAQLITMDDEYFQVYGNYPGYETDPNPANEWRVYLGEDTMPVPGTDTPIITGTIAGTEMTTKIGPYVTGGIVYNLAITVYRTADGTESEAATYQLDLEADPDKPVPVRSGYQLL